MTIAEIQQEIMRMKKEQDVCILIIWEILMASVCRLPKAGAKM